MINKLWTFIKWLFGAKLCDKHGYIDTDLLMYKLTKANRNFNRKHPELDPSSPYYDDEENERVKILFMEKIKNHD